MENKMKKAFMNVKVNVNGNQKGTSFCLGHGRKGK